jgi:hypothetical protein
MDNDYLTPCGPALEFTVLLAILCLQSLPSTL